MKARKVVTAKLDRLTSTLATQVGMLITQHKALESERESIKGPVKELVSGPHRDKMRITFEKRTSKDTGNVTLVYTYSPKQSPYALVVSRFDVKDLKYKDLFEGLFLKHEGKQEDLDKFYAEADTREQVELEVKPNPNYKGGE